MSILNQIAVDLQEGKADSVKDNVKKALSNGFTADEVLHKGLMRGMKVIGTKFKNDEIFVPEVLVGARAMKSGMEVLKPALIEDQVESEGKVLLGTVKGDLHDIGKNLVSMMLEGGGYEVVDLGVDVGADEFVKKLRETKADILAMSALLTTTLSEMQNVIEILAEEGLKNKVKVVIGGAPVSKEYAEEIGADGYAPDAASAVDAVDELLTK